MAQEHNRQPPRLAQILDAHQPFDFGNDAALFLRLAQGCGFRRLAYVYHTPRYAPLSRQIVAWGLTHKQNPIPV
jgi:hypothetical protein